ncbi:MAG: hypothetical protein IK100_09055 [Muribaculaceae bacterium]|nr:hypothetical protein [Muribaculaceae bacterium]MBR5118777.1 hypothetical protein [Muribaculaceae bacterium]
MKETSFNVIPAIIAIAVAALIGLLAATLCESRHDTIIGITTGVSLAVTLLPMLAIRSSARGLNVNMRLVSTIFVVLVLLVNFIVCFNTPNKLTIYFIIIGLILLTYIGVLYSLIRRSTE